MDAHFQAQQNNLTMDQESPRDAQVQLIDLQWNNDALSSTPSFRETMMLYRVGIIGIYKRLSLSSFG